MRKLHKGRIGASTVILRGKGSEIFEDSEVLKKTKCVINDKYRGNIWWESVTMSEISSPCGYDNKTVKMKFGSQNYFSFRKIQGKRRRVKHQWQCFSRISSTSFNFLGWWGYSTVERVQILQPNPRLQKSTRQLGLSTSNTPHNKSIRIHRLLHVYPRILYTSFNTPKVPMETLWVTPDQNCAPERITSEKR